MTERHSQEGVCRTGQDTRRVQSRRDAEEQTEIQTGREKLRGSRQTGRREENRKLLVKG